VCFGSMRMDCKERVCGRMEDALWETVWKYVECSAISSAGGIIGLYEGKNSKMEDRSR